MLALAWLMPGMAYAAQQGKIVCWKDAAGKVIGCGDKVPPEYQSSGTKELDSRGVTRGTTESAEEVNKRRQKEQEAARVKSEEQRKSVDQKRQDTALLETYSNEKEIDLKRDRDLQVHRSADRAAHDVARRTRRSVTPTRRPAWTPSRRATSRSAPS